MNFHFISRVCRLAAVGAILLGSASCVEINEELGENFIPTDQKWDVYNPEAVNLKNLSSFDTTNVQDMRAMFEYCNALTSLDLSTFNTTNVRDTTFMFYDCPAGSDWEHILK